MLKIQETGKNGGFFDVKPGTSAPVNFGNRDIRKPAESKGAWSKTVTLSATKNNGVRLGYLFGINVLTSTFDYQKKLPVLLLENDQEIQGYFFMQLKGINKKRGRVVSYEVIVKDDVSDFFTDINGKYLTDIDFSDNNHFLTAANVAATFNKTFANSDYKYHLTMNDDDSFDLSQFKLAIWARKYWDRIHAKAGKSYEWGSMNSADVQFDKWIVPSNVDKVESDNNAVVVATESTWLRQNTGVSGVPAGWFLEPFRVGTEVWDVANLYNPATGKYTSPVTVPAGSSIIMNLKFRYQTFIRNNTANSIKLYNATLQHVPRVYVLKNGAALTQALIPVQPNLGTVAVGTTIAPSASLNIQDGLVEFNINVSGFNAGDLLELTQTLQVTGYGTTGYWGNASTGVAASVTNNLLITGIELSILPNGGNGYGYGEWIEVNKLIPQKVKQSEFIAAIMTLNNLMIDREKTTPNKIVYTKRDEYLDSGTVKDWDAALKLDKSQEHEITFLQDVTAKRVVHTYKEDKDAANEGYKANTREIYGQSEYTFRSEFAKDTDTIDIVFSPTPMAQTVFGAVVPLYSGKEPGCNIRLLFDGGVKSCAPFKIVNFPGNELQVSTGYPYVGHFDDPLAPKLDLNFGLCDYYFYGAIKAFTNRNMFNLNWRRTMNQIDKGRMLTGWFKLDELDIKTMKLNDKIFVENEYWNINKVIDYDPNGKGTTKVELVSVDDLLKIPTKTKSPGVVNPGVGIANPIKAVVSKVTGALNSYAGTGNVMILGKRNIVANTVKSALIIGDSQTVEEDGVYTPVLKVTGDAPADFCASGIKVDDIYPCSGTTTMHEQVDFDNVPTVGGLPFPGYTPSARITAWDALNVTGLIVQTSTTSWVSRTITTPNAGLTTTNGNGVSGNPTIVLSDDVAAVEALATTGIAVRTGTSTWATRQINGTAGQIVVTNGTGVAGNITLALDSAITSGLGLWVVGNSGTGNIKPAVANNTLTGNYTTVLSGQNNTGAGQQSVVFGQWCVVGASGNGSFAGGFGTSATAANTVSAQSAFSFQRVNSVGTYGVSATDGAILGGLNNNVTAFQGAILGGYTNSVTAQAAAVVGGNGNSAAGANAIVLGGATNAITGAATVHSAILGGTNNTIVMPGLTATNASAIIAGSANTISGSEFSVIAGGQNNTVTRYSELAYGVDGTKGQCGAWTCYTTTTNATITELFASGTERFTVSTNETYHAKVTVVGRRTVGGTVGQSVSFTHESLIKDVGGTTTLIANTAQVTLGDLVGTVLTVNADNVNKSLRLQVTGLVGSTIDWFAKVEYTLVK